MRADEQRAAAQLADPVERVWIVELDLAGETPGPHGALVEHRPAEREEMIQRRERLGRWSAERAKLSAHARQIFARGAARNLRGEPEVDDDRPEQQPRCPPADAVRGVQEAHAGDVAALGNFGPVLAALDAHLPPRSSSRPLL